MKNKQLKYLKLFEGLTPEEIPYSEIVRGGGGMINIIIPEDVKELPKVYNQLTDEVTGYLSIKKKQIAHQCNRV